MRSSDFKKNELKPWLNKEWCIPPERNAEFVCQMEEVLDVYKRPYNSKYPQVCMDESSKQLIDEIREPIAVEYGKPAKYDTEYIRNGTTNIFIAYEPLAGKRVTKVTYRRTKVDWAKFIKELVDTHYPNAEKIILVMDNLNTHNKSSLYQAFLPAEAKRIADRLEIHYTPKHGSWLNMAEIELSHLSRQCLNRRIADKNTVSSEIKAWNVDRNNLKHAAKWRFTTENSRIKLAKLYPLI